MLHFPLLQCALCKSVGICDRLLLLGFPLVSPQLECSLQGALWQRKGWKEMDKMRAQLEDLRELRDLVRSLGRGGGGGPLRRAPVQYLDMKGRPGLLRTILEQQETRGLTRSDDISRLLPSEVMLMIVP